MTAGDDSALTLRYAQGFRGRLLGLLAPDALGGAQGLCLQPCRAVHTLGMRRAIDVVFLDRHGRVLRCVERLRPGRAAFCWRAALAVELPAGYCRRHGDYPARIRAALRRRPAGTGGRTRFRRRDKSCCRESPRTPGSKAS